MSARDPSRAAQDAVRDQLVAAARREPDPARAAQTALRDQLVAAARRETVPVRRRRRRLKIAGLGVAVALGATAGATATGLISVGAPLPTPLDLDASDPRFGVTSPEGVDLVAQASDPGHKLKAGVAIYQSADGRRCVIAGEVRGTALGLERRGTFRPYSGLRTGACIAPNGTRVLDSIQIRSSPPRTLVFGRTTEPGFTVFPGGKPHRARLTRGGAFLFVFDGLLTPADLVRK